MCGRITQNLKLDTLAEKYGVRNDPELDLTPHYNGAPGQDFVAVRAVGMERVLKELHWGEIPSWARNKPGAKRLINARSETVLEKPTFRSAFRQRRCIIPVNGWFEWRPENGQKQPYWIRPEDTEVFSLAGIWESGGTSPGSIGTFVILTMAAEPEFADILDRTQHTVTMRLYVATRDFRIASGREHETHAFFLGTTHAALNICRPRIVGAHSRLQRDLHIRDTLRALDHRMRAM